MGAAGCQADGDGLLRGVGEQGPSGTATTCTLEPSLTEEKVEYHIGRYKAERKMMEQSRATPCRIIVGCGIILFVLALFFLIFLIYAELLYFFLISLFRGSDES